MSLRILQVLPRIAVRSSGPSYSVTRLSEELATAGHSVRLAVLDPVPAEPRSFEVTGYPCSRFPGAERLGWSPSMRAGLRREAEQAQIVHNHSMWMMPNIYSAEAAARSRVPLVFSPRGTVSEWARRRSRVRKEVVWRLGQRNAMFSAACVHATSASELDDLRSLGIRAPIAVVPNGIDVPDSLLATSRRGEPSTLMFLSRIHAKKGVDMLLRSWARLESSFPQWQLRIVGPLAGEFPARMQSLAAELRLERCTFVGELLGQAKAEALAAADLFVLPTHSENFGIAIAEALAHGTPVLTTDGAPWASLADHDCGWSVPVDVDALETGLRHAMGMSSESLKRMGLRGRDWMIRDFSWARVGNEMDAVYQWLLGAGPRPACVSTAQGIS